MLQQLIAKPQVHVYNSVAIGPIGSGVATKLTFDTVRDDLYTEDGMYEAANPGRLYARAAGEHLAHASVEWAANAVGRRRIAFIFSGTGTAVAHLAVPAVADAAAATRLSLATPIRMAAGDYIEVEVLQLSGGNLNVNRIADYSPEASLTWLSA